MTRALKVLALDSRASINDDEDLVEGLLESSVAEKPPSKWPYVGLVVFGGFTGVLGVATTFTSA